MIEGGLTVGDPKLDRELEAFHKFRVENPQYEKDGQELPVGEFNKMHMFHFACHKAGMKDHNEEAL